MRRSRWVLILRGRLDCWGRSNVVSVLNRGLKYDGKSCRMRSENAYRLVF